MIDTGSMSSENVKGILDWIMYLRSKYVVDRDDFANVGANSQAQLLAGMIKDLEKLQDIIEEYRN